MKIADNVLAVLSSALTHGNELTLTGQLDRKLYEQTNKVLEAAGGKWSKKAKAHVFDGDAADRMEQILLTGDVVVPKDEFQFFPTPPELAAQVVKLAKIEAGMLVLEPSAGLGALALLAAKAADRVAVDMYDLMPANCDALRALDMPMSAVSNPIDFLTIEPHRSYDRVVMNPPFSKQADIKHVTHALKFLKPGGRLVAIMAAGVLYRQDQRTTTFKQLIRDIHRAEVIENPEGAFKSSGTMVRTVTIAVDVAA